MGFSLRRWINRITNRNPIVGAPPVGPDDYPASFDGNISSLGLSAGSPLIIPAGQNWLLDTNTPALGAVTVAGGLYASLTQTTSLTALYVNVTATGRYQCGTPTSRLPKAYTHTIECNNTEQGKVVAYSTWQTAASGSTSTGLMKAIWEGAGIDRAENYTVTFTSATAFNVVGSSSGSLGSGTVGTAFNNKIHFVATGTFATGNTRTLTSQAKGFNNTGLTSRGFVVDDGGQLKLFGFQKTHRARLQATVGNTFAAGATALKLDITPSDWDSGDTVAIGPTEFYEWGTGGSDVANVDSRTLTASMTDTNMSINTGLSRARWAVLQYVNQSANDGFGRGVGAVTTTNTGYTSHTTAPTIIDQRAWVGNLTRNIKFQGPNDAAWNDTTNGRVGAHLMIMGRSDGKVKIDHVEFTRCGQRGRHGRYPLHFHMNSYEMPYGMTKPSNGVSKGAMTDTYVRGCTVNSSAQHGIQLHGVMGVEITNCVTYGVAGHAFNLEDGSERRNVFTNNLALHTTEMPDSTTLQLRKHEANAAGFWITNPDNDLTGNVSVRAIHNIWLSPAEACFGLSRDIAIRPSHCMHGIMLNQYAMCSKQQGVLTGHIVSDELGTATGGSGYYWPTPDEVSDANALLFTLTGYQIYKSGNDAYTNRGGYPRYVNFITCDNARTDFSGSISMGKIVDSTIVNYSANTGTRATGGISYTSATIPTRRGMASYHYTLVPEGCVFIGFGATWPADTVDPNGAAPNPFKFNPDGKISGVEATSGAIGSDDLYMKAVEVGLVNISNNKFLSSMVSPFSRNWTMRIKSTGQTATNMYTSIAGAKWDPNGLITTAGNYVVWNDPMYTYGVTPTTIPDELHSVSVNPATCLPYGLKIYQNNNDTGRLASMDIIRMDPTTDATVGTWFLGARDTVPLGKDKMFIPFVKNATVRITLQSGRRPSTYLSFHLENANRVDDTGIIGVSWIGANANPSVYLYWSDRTGVDTPSAGDYSGGYARNFSNAGISSFAQLKASAGNTYWYDQANGYIWIKFLGGITRGETMGDPTKSFNEWQYLQANTLYVRN